MVLAGLRERLQPLTTRLFPPRVLLVLEDEELMLLALKAGSSPVEGTALRRVPLPRGACLNGLPLQKVALGDLIGDLLVELGLLGAELVACLPAAASSWRIVQWPFDQWPEEPEQALRQIDPDLGLPYPLGDAYLTLLPLTGQAGGPPLSSLLVTSPRELVQAWIDVLNIAGFSLDRLDAAQACELRAVAPLLAEAASTDLIALTELRSHGAQLTLVRNGVPEYSRRLEAFDGDLAGELQRCVAYWRQRDPAVRAVRVLLFGASSGWEGLAAALRDSRDWTVEVVDPLERGWLILSGPAAEAEEDTPVPDGREGPGLVRLCGLAMTEVTA